MTFLVDTALGCDGLVVLRCELWGYNAIGVVSGEEALAVDPGIKPDELATFRSRLRAGGARRVPNVLLTHSHHDHIRGWNAFEGAQVVAPELVADKEEGPRKRILAGKAAVDRRMGVSEPDFGYPEIDVTFAARHELRVGGLDVLLELVPGHSNCSSIAVIPALGTLLAADYLVSPGLPYCRFEAQPFEAANRRLLELVREHDIELVVPAHNELIRGRGSIEAAIALELDYFEALRAAVDSEMISGASDDEIVRRCEVRMGAWRGEDLGPKARQDADNAKRVLAEVRGR